jgi:hypothetical protein
VRRAALAIALAGCGDVSAFQCNSDEECTDRDGVMGTCAEPGFCAFSDSTCMSGLRYDEVSAGSFAGQCVDTGFGPLGDTGDHPRPLQPFQRVDVTHAHDDYASSCNTEDDVDIYFEVTLDQQSRIYVDTFGTDFKVQLSVREGSCASLGADRGCFDNVCSTLLQQYSDILNAGTYCIIMDRVAGEANTNLVVRSMIGPPADTGTIGANNGDTCTADDWTASCGGSALPDQTWFFMSCSATTYIVDPCNTFDGVFQGWILDGMEAACADGNTGIDVQLVEPGPAWIVAEAASVGTCGNVCATITQ